MTTLSSVFPKSPLRIFTWTTDGHSREVDLKGRFSALVHNGTTYDCVCASFLETNSFVSLNSLEKKVGVRMVIKLILFQEVVVSITAASTIF